MGAEVKEKSNLDDVLNKFGIFSPYHRKMMLILALAYASNTAFSSNFIFTAEQVNYRCADERFSNDTCGTINSTTCPEWIYEKTDSFVAEFQLACQEWKRTLVGTMRSIAYMIGLLFVGPLSDRLGRKYMMVVTGVLGAILGIGRSFSTSYWLYIVIESFESAFGDICSPTYILNIEFVSNKKRVPYFLITSFGYSLGSVYKALVAYFVPDFRNFLRVLYSPALLFLLYIFLVDESPRWLLIKGRKKEAVEIVEKIAKKNNVKIEKNVLDNLACETDNEEDNLKFSKVLKTTFSSLTLLKRFLVCVVWWTTSTFVNYGMAITSVSLEGNKYLNYALSDLTELPGNIITIYVLRKYRRKYPLIVTFFLAGFFIIGQPFLPTNLSWLSIIMFMIGRLMVCLYFNITYIYTSELFPTYTRNSMHALCSSIGRIGSMIAPQAPLLLFYWHGLPALIFGIVSIVAGLLTFTITDIADISLPDTVKEAEAVGIKENGNSKDIHIKVIAGEFDDVDKELGIRNRGFEPTH